MSQFVPSLLLIKLQLDKDIPPPAPPATTVLAGVITLASTQVDERLSGPPALVFPITRTPVPLAILGRPRLSPLV